MKKILRPISAAFLIGSAGLYAQNAQTSGPAQSPVSQAQPHPPAAAQAPAATPAAAPQASSQEAAAPAQAAAVGTAPAPQLSQQAPAAPTSTFTQEQLDTALAPIALYPDSLLAQLLMATTYPDQVLEAAKWSKEHPKLKGEEAVKAVQDKNWDPSVASLAAFPDVLDMLSKKPEWVKELGEMFLADPDAVMNTIQSLRRKAKEAGNLKSTKEQEVVVKEAKSTATGGSASSSSTGGNTIIEIQPTNPQTVYVPVYNPTTVYGSWWHPTPPFYYHPPYYNPVASIIGFGAAIAVGHALWSHWDWHRHDIDINVNRYNNINIKNRIDIRNKRASWRQEIRERNPRFKQIDRSKARDRLKDRQTRPALNDRGRELQRLKAKQQLKERGGVDLDRARKNLQRNPEKVRQAVDRVNRMSPAQKQQLRDRARDRKASAGQIKRPSRDLKRPAAQRPAAKRPLNKRPAIQRPATKVKRPANRPRPKIQRPQTRPKAARPRPSRPSGAARARRAR